MMNKFMQLLATGLVVLLSPVSSGFAAESSTVATAQDNIVVNTTSQVTLLLTPVTTILASTYQSGTRLAGWSASATAGSIAVRLNPTIMKTTDPSNGTATSTTNTNNTIGVSVVSGNFCNGGGGAVSSSGWIICAQGASSASGTLVTRANQSISVGTYPLSVDAAVWQY